MALTSCEQIGWDRRVAELNGTIEKAQAELTVLHNLPPEPDLSSGEPVYVEITSIGMGGRLRAVLVVGRQGGTWTYIRDGASRTWNELFIGFGHLFRVQVATMTTTLDTFPREG